MSGERRSASGTKQIWYTEGNGKSCSAVRVSALPTVLEVLLCKVPPTVHTEQRLY